MVKWVAVHWACKLALSLTLLWHGSGGVAAIWLGAQTPHRAAWVQAGVASDSFGTYVYAEWKRPGRTPVDKFEPAQLGDVEHARLVHRGRYWRAEIDGLRTPGLVLRRAVHCNALELQDGAHAVARVGWRIESG